MFGIFNKRQIPPEIAVAFKAYQNNGITLERPAKLMPCFDTFGYRGTMRALKRIVALPTGTRLTFKSVRMKGARAWYKVRAFTTSTSGASLTIDGWVNSVIFDIGHATKRRTD